MKGIIVDDEQNVGIYLQKVIEKNTPIQIVDLYTNPFEGFFKIVDLKPDIVFLDISMPQISGIELAKQIIETYPFCDILFITAHTEYYDAAKQLNSVGYIIKPATDEKIKQFYNAYNKDLAKLHNQVSKMEDLTPQQGRKIFVSKEGGVKVIDIEDIYYLESDRNIVRIITKDDVYHARKTLTYYEKTLSNFDFFRCHRGYIVNIHAVESITRSGLSTYDLKFKDIEKIICVSRDKYKTLREILRKINS
ncbi:MAG: response regulator transcription factor [Firmicutes bacterium]|nr:response regulator transcription factor [Bacillota bacterium]